MSAATRPPRSVTNYAVNLVGVLGALVAILVFRARGTPSLYAAPVVCIAGVAPIVALDLLVLKVYARASTGLDWGRPPSSDLRRVATKTLGLAVTVAPFLLGYWCFPVYADDWAHTFFPNARQFAVSLALVAVLYIWVVDGQMREPRDTYWHLGRLVLGDPSGLNRAQVADHYRGWLIKAFYLPMFLGSANNQLNGVIQFDLSNLRGGGDLRLFHFGNDLIYGLDVLYAAAGYVLSVRLLDSHVRSAEPTMLGWAVALECYAPFWPKLFNPLYLDYQGPGFEAALRGHLPLVWIVGAIILGLEGIYVLATFAFGVRFSNLTHRGTLTNGPYRYSKHPAYIAKNISWWLVTMPFLPFHGWAEAVKSSLALGGIGVVYFLRARTEERHLSKDPVYVEYALWMNDHGVLRFLNRVPFFKYKAPAGPPR
jgi:protein-S-isoprenylcysteine O-methyltransferase Ste14